MQCLGKWASQDNVTSNVTEQVGEQMRTQTVKPDFSDCQTPLIALEKKHHMTIRVGTSCANNRNGLRCHSRTNPAIGDKSFFRRVSQPRAGVGDA